MRENRPYGSEGGAARKGRPYPYPGWAILRRGVPLGLRRFAGERNRGDYAVTVTAARRIACGPW